MFQTCAYLYSSNFSPQVKKARNQSQIFNRKSISRNTTHRQSLHLQAMSTGETLKGQHKVRESKLQDCNEKTAQTQPRQIKQNQNVLPQFVVSTLFNPENCLLMQSYIFNSKCLQCRRRLQVTRRVKPTSHVHSWRYNTGMANLQLCHQSCSILLHHVFCKNLAEEALVCKTSNEALSVCKLVNRLFQDHPHWLAILSCYKCIPVTVKNVAQQWNDDVKWHCFRHWGIILPVYWKLNKKVKEIEEEMDSQSTLDPELKFMINAKIVCGFSKNESAKGNTAAFTLYDTVYVAEPNIWGSRSIMIPQGFLQVEGTIYPL